MAKRSVAPVLPEILEALDGIETHTAGKSLADFQSDWLLRLAVQRASEKDPRHRQHIAARIS